MLSEARHAQLADPCLVYRGEDDAAARREADEQRGAYRYANALAPD
jgi:hypothetical protein